MATTRRVIRTSVIDLKLLARGLDIAESDKLIRNAIACKSLDKRVRQKCLEKSKGLTLDTAIDIGRMFEATKDGMQVMVGEDPRVEINTLAGKNVAPRKRRKAKQSESKGKPQAQECMRCSYNYHKQNEKCLEKNASCRRCNKIGHFASVYKSSKVHSMEENYSSDDEEGLDQDMHLLRVTGLEVNGVNDSPATGENDECWESVQVNDHALQCQLETGAYASVLNANQLQQIAPKATVKPTNKTLVSYSQHRITPVGCVSLPVRYKGRTIHVKFYFIENQPEEGSLDNQRKGSLEKQQKPILSGKVCQALNLIQRVHKLDTSLQELLEQHPELEHASGAIPGTYSIKTDPTAKPQNCCPRSPQTACSTSTQIKERLKEMEKEGHLAKVTQPTD